LEPTDLEILTEIMGHEYELAQATKFSERVAVRAETVARIRALFTRSNSN